MIPLMSSSLFGPHAIWLKRHTGGAQRTGGAVWSSWREILGIAGDIGNLQGVGEDRNQNEGEDTEGGGQAESDGAIARRRRLQN